MSNDHNSTDDFSDDPQQPKSITRFITIPKILHSVEKDMPFRNCIECGADLLATNRHYVIEKVFRRNEVIIELAICLNCREGQCDDGISESSAATMQQFVTERIDYEQRLRLMSFVNESDSIDPWLERCILSDHPSQMFSEYQIVALCRGPWIQRDFYPALISGRSLEALSDLLSKETRDWLDDYIGTNFGMPSEFCDNPKISPLLL